MCTCEVCVKACRIKPGWFMPGEAERVARFKGLTMQELFKNFLMVDWYVDEPSIYLLGPATLEREPGGFYSQQGYGHCIFQQPDGLCSIYGVRPFECREYLHHEDNRIVMARHQKVAEAWKGHQDQIQMLVGRALSIPKPECESEEIEACW